MWPFIRAGKDSVEIVPIERPLKKDDVVLFEYGPDMFMLHRVVKKRGTTYILRGDNNTAFEKGIKENQIIGVVRGYYRGETYIPAQSLKLRSALAIWKMYRPFRRVLRKIKRMFFKRIQ